MTEIKRRFGNVASRGMTWHVMLRCYAQMLGYQVDMHSLNKYDSTVRSTTRHHVFNLGRIACLTSFRG